MMQKKRFSMPISNRDEENEGATGGGIDDSLILPDLKTTNNTPIYASALASYEKKKPHILLE